MTAHASASGLILTLPDLSTEAWPAPPPETRFRLGSEAHKRLFCRTLLDTFDPYRPAIIDWPKLTDDALGRLTSLPIWDIAVQTEGRAMRRVHAYADMVRDPLLKKAVELNAYEEGRHKLVLSNLVEAYGIRLEPEPQYNHPKDPEWSFLVTGFSECVDSFFAFGLFDAAKRTGFFPEELVETFEPVIAEEGRPIRGTKLGRTSRRSYLPSRRSFSDRHRSISWATSISAPSCWAPFMVKLLSCWPWVTSEAMPMRS